MSSSIDESKLRMQASEPQGMKEFEEMTYNELSKEFKSAYTRACQFVPLMYNQARADGLSHLQAIRKIYADHQDLPGFSTRNIYRYLPADNPNIPRRVMTSRHKNSCTETVEPELRSNEQGDDKVGVEDLENNNNNSTDEISNEEESENESEPQQSEKLNDDNVSAPQSSNPSYNNDDLLAFEFGLEWECVRNYMNELYKSENTLKIWFNGELDKRTGKVIAADTGRKEDGNRTSEEGHSIE